ncbi:membrane protein [Bradyrhizobium sp. AS23.2]|nr:membrane protein [Bradyrhizobium sp. AS23.2]
MGRLRMSRRGMLTLPIGAAASTAIAQLPAFAQTDLPVRTNDEAEAAQIATDAYVFGYPLVTTYMTRQVMTNVARPEGIRSPVNQFANVREYPTATFTGITAPNADTLYSEGWLDLGPEPIVLSWPDMGDRYYLFPMLDAWTNVIAAPGTRTTGGGAQAYVITGPRYTGPVPADLPRISSPTDLLWVHGRTYCTGTPEDYKKVHALQDQYRLVPLSAWGKGEYKPPVSKVDPSVDMKTAVRDQVERLSPADYFALLAKLMATNGPVAADAAAMAHFARIGLVPGQPFDFSTLPPAIQRGVSNAREAGIKRIMGQDKGGGLALENGWVVMLKTGVYGTDYVQRAFVTAVGLGANDPKDAVYPFTQMDAQGAKLDGKNKYVIRFAPGAFPPARGFWSLTMYNDKWFFVANPLNRYTLSQRNTLKRNADGSTELYLQADYPGKDRESNWLPTPQGEFILMFRLYMPEEAPAFSILDGTWKPPSVQKV